MPKAVFDNSDILDDCFRKLSRVNSVTRDYKKISGITGGYVDIWLVETEIEISNRAIDISYYLCFKYTFPHSLPKVILKKYDLPHKYIPHVEENNSMCLFEDNVIYSTDNHFGIIQECLCRANKVIKDGYENVNKSHFTEEIKAYWNNRYGNEPEPIPGFVHSFLSYPIHTCTVNVICQTRELFGGYKYIIYDSEEQGLIRFFNSCKKNDFSLSQGLFIADLTIPDTPPYFITNNMLIGMLSADSIVQFRKYINSKNQAEKYVFFYLNRSGLIGGIRYPIIETNIKGFRPNTLSHFDILTNQKKSEKVRRLLSVEYSNNRIENRTSGEISRKYKFLIAGLGSVGSHLVYFLNNINHPDFTFIDNDILSIDNIGRHLLGYADVRKAKVDAMVEYIKLIRPDQNVFGSQTVFEEYINTHLDGINKNDYLFVAIGNKQAENFLIKMMVDNIISVPVFILWVEPYLASGQCLYLKPHDAHKYHDQFCKSSYNHHVISNDEYSNFENPKLERREAGCQASFSPYSSNDLVLYLSALYPHINNVIKGLRQSSFRFCWIGGLDKITELKITISDGYSSNDSFTSKLVEI